mmetsp:Transcript_39914/g.97840  ORF Transcript_39914/g.97840 Transcript_39914/m.97840 type:complete len:418 (-) Transcript_39914:590-1843(-)
MEARARAEEERRRIVGALARLGDQSRGTSDIAAAVRRLLNASLCDQMPTHWESIGYALVRCGTELPHKASVYATVAGVLTSNSPPTRTGSDGAPDADADADADGAHPFARQAEALANYLVQGIRNYIAHSIRDGKGGAARRALRFLCELAVAKVVHPQALAAAVAGILKAALAESEQARSPLHARAMFLFDVAVSAVPWCGALLDEHDPETLVAIGKDAEELCDAAADKWAPMFCTAPGSEALGFRVPVVEEARAAIRDLKTRDWECTAVVRLQPLFVQELSDGRLLKFQPVAVPAHSKTSRYAPPRFWWRMRSPADEMQVDQPEAAEPPTESEAAAAAAGGAGARTAPTSPADRFVVRELIGDVLENFVSDHALASKQIVNMPLPFDVDREVCDTAFRRHRCPTWLTPPLSCLYRL